MVMLSLENPWEVMESTHANLTQMERPIESTISPVAGVYPSVATAISEISNSQQNREANVEIAPKR